MCGLAGVIAWSQQYQITREVLAAMSRSIRHRGPDGQGIFFSPPAALVHRRLAILDPDPRSNQPFTDGVRYLVFNGEIFNFRDLRRQLSDLSPQYAWQTTGDTEVLLQAHATWGPSCVDRLNGMFAFAIWDSRQQTLFLARDRMGQKPLYLAVAPDAQAVAFASEIAALRAVPWVSRQVDPQGVTQYLQYGCSSGSRTIYRQIEKILPAHIRQFSPNNDSGNQRYWSPSVAPSTASPRQLIETAVRRQLVSDVPLGCFLSGGIDSSVIAAAMKKIAGDSQPVLTFSIGFDDARYDETRYAQTVADHLGTIHQSAIVTPDAAADLPALAQVFGEPFGDSSALPTHYLSRQTRQHVKVALSGDGGDELFGGYDRYRAMRWSQTARHLPFLHRLAQNLSGAHPKSKRDRLRRFLSTLDLPPAQRYASYLRIFDDTQIAALLKSPAPTPDAIANAYEIELRAGRDLMTAALATDRVTYLPDDPLTKLDRASMLHALEVRSPFLDHELVQFAASLSPDQLFRGGKKRLLRESFSADVPPWVFRRPKMGFALPIGQWLRESLRPMLHDLIFSSDSFSTAWFHLPAITSLIDQHQTQSADHSQRLYALLMLELWWRTNAS